MVEFANDFIAVDRWGGGSCWFADASKFASFMHLKMVVCIGRDCLDDVCRCLMFWGWCGSCDGDVCTDGSVGAAVVGGGVQVERYVKRSCSGVRSEVKVHFDVQFGVWVDVFCLRQCW